MASAMLPINDNDNVITNNRVYADSEDKFVKNTIVYQGADVYLYFDKERTTRIPKDMVVKLFLSGMIVATVSVSNGDIVSFTIPHVIGIRKNSDGTKYASVQIDNNTSVYSSEYVAS